MIGQQPDTCFFSLMNLAFPRRLPFTKTKAKTCPKRVPAWQGWQGKFAAWVTCMHLMQDYPTMFCCQLLWLFWCQGQVDLWTHGSRNEHLAWKLCTRITLCEVGLLCEVVNGLGSLYESTLSLGLTSGMSAAFETSWQWCHDKNQVDLGPWSFGKNAADLGFLET